MIRLIKMRGVSGMFNSRPLGRPRTQVGPGGVTHPVWPFGPVSCKQTDFNLHVCRLKDLGMAETIYGNIGVESEVYPCVFGIRCLCRAYPLLLCKCVLKQEPQQGNTWGD